MATAVKRKASESSKGKCVLVAATSSPGTLIHTCPNLDGEGDWDELWLYAMNNHTADVQLTVEFGSTDAKDKIVLTVPAQAGLVPITPGLILQDEATVAAFAAVANVVSIHVFNNRITD
jgi:hypothetical protein